MSGFIVLNDGRAWTSSNDGFDTVIEHIADYVAQVNQAHALRSWLLDQRSSVLGPGLGAIDVRELTPHNQEVILDAIEAVCGQQELAADLTHREDMVRLLAAMVRSYRNGEPPSALNPLMKGILPPTEDRSGPGW